MTKTRSNLRYSERDIQIPESLGFCCFPSEIEVQTVSRKCVCGGGGGGISPYLTMLKKDFYTNEKIPPFLL